MKKYQINEKVISMLASCFGVEAEVFTKESMTLPLTGNVFQLSSYDLAYLYLFVCKEFQIQIPEEDLMEEQFNSVSGIVACIQKYLDQQAVQRAG